MKNPTFLVVYFWHGEAFIMEFTPEQERQIRALQATFPYRIIYATKAKDTGEFFASAVTSMRIPNRLQREGHEVVIVKSK